MQKQLPSKDPVHCHTAYHSFNGCQNGSDSGTFDASATLSGSTICKPKAHQWLNGTQVSNIQLEEEKVASFCQLQGKVELEVPLVG